MDLLAAIEHQEALAQGYGTLNQERSDALDQYMGRPYGDEVEGRSQVVMRDVHDTVEWILPSLMKVFASGDEVCEFQPVGPEDEEQAKQETDYINHVLMQKNPGFLVLHDMFHDALVQRNGYVIVGREVENRKQRDVYRGLTDDEFAQLAKDPEVEVVEYSKNTVYDIDAGGYVTHDAVIEAKREYGCTKVRNIPPERVLVSADWPDVDLQNCPFVEVIEYLTASELRQQGYEVPDDISDDQDSEEFDMEQRRNIDEDGSIFREDSEVDESTRLLRVRRVWIRYDKDGDGLAELHRVVVVGKTILEDEEDDLVPVAALTPKRIPHEHVGMSIADMVEDLQRIRTTLVRGYLDNMYLANNGRHAIDKGRVNLSDMLVARPGGVVRVDGDPSSAIVPLAHVQQGPAILQAIEYVDTVRENRTGVTRYNQGLDANSLNKTATGVNQIMQAAQQRIEMIARMFAETGVKALMLIIHATSLKHSRQTEMVKLRNKWVPINPATWKTRRDMTVSVGIGTGNKDQMLQHLTMIWQMQVAGLQFGIAQPQNLYETATKITQNAGFKVVDAFWSDPAKFQPPPPPPSPEQIKAQAEQQKLQFQAAQDAQKFQAEQANEDRRMQMQAELERHREEMQARQKMLEAEQAQRLSMLEIEAQERIKSAELMFQKWQTELQATVQVALHQASAAQAETGPDPRLEQLAQAVKEMSMALEEQKQPAEFIPGPDGKIAYIKRGNSLRQVKRDTKTGRPIGLH